MKQIGLSFLLILLAGNSVYSQWVVTCEDDPIEDRRTCDLYANLLATSVLVMSTPARPTQFNSGYRTLIAFGKRLYPSSWVTIRIDGNKPISWRENELLDASRIIQEKVIPQMIRGSKMLTRYRQWPDGNYTDDQVSLKGFTAGWEKAKAKMLEWHKNRP